MAAINTPKITSQGKLPHYAEVSRHLKIKEIVEKRTQALKISNDELESFAYAASHDLKAPLRSIDQLSSWLEEDLGDALQGEHKDNMMTLRGQVKRMQKLLEDLLVYSRLGREQNGAKNNTVSGNDILKNVLGLAAAPHGFTLHADNIFCSTLFHEMPLTQVLYNLVTNAIKHHDKDHGTIHISAHHHFTYLTVRVTDDGPGIAEEYQSRIFDMFQTLKPRDQVEGSGMGLAIVKKMITNYGVSVKIDSTFKGGCCFVLDFPKIAANEP
jgi:signal transduction histidine kinase